VDVMVSGVNRLSNGRGSASLIGACDGMISLDLGDSGGVGGLATGMENGKNEVRRDERATAGGRGSVC
jgi:hypothetical protein